MMRLDTGQPLFHKPVIEEASCTRCFNTIESEHTLVMVSMTGHGIKGEV